MALAISFRGRRIRAIAFDGGGTVYPKGAQKTRISPAISSLLTANPALKLALISVNSSEADLERVAYPLKETLEAQDRLADLSCYVDGGARLVTFGPEEKSDKEYSRPFLIFKDEIEKIREAMCRALVSRLGLDPAEQITWSNFYREKQSSARVPWLETVTRKYPLEHFPLLDPQQAKTPAYAPWLERRGEDLAPDGALMLAIKPLPRDPRDVREEVIAQICGQKPSLPERLRILPGGYASIDIMHKDAGKKAALEHFMGSKNLEPNEVVYIGDELTPNREDSDLLLPQFSKMPKVAVNLPGMPVAENIPNLFYDPARIGPEGTALWLKEIG